MTTYHVQVSFKAVPEFAPRIENVYGAYKIEVSDGIFYVYTLNVDYMFPVENVLMIKQTVMDSEAEAKQHE